MRSLKHSFISTVAASAFYMSGATAMDFNIDFEGFQHGQVIDTEYDFVTIGADNFVNDVDLAVAFDTTSPKNPPDYLLDLNGPFDEGPSVINPGNILVIQRNGRCGPDLCDDPDDEGGRGRGQAGTFFFEFAEVVSIASIDFFDVEMREAGAPVTFFDENGNEILQYLTEATTMQNWPDGADGAKSWTQVTFDVLGVKRIELVMGGSGGIDNIRGMAVPIPAVAFLFPSGLLAGLLYIRRRTSLGVSRAA